MKFPAVKACDHLDYKRKSIEQLALVLPKITNDIYVLHGLDPSTCEVGRDLDVFICDSASHDRVIAAYAEILARMGAEWVMIMPPIWGKRCIGVWADNYSFCELHILPSVRMGPVSGEHVRSRFSINDYNGFCFDPWLYVFKSVVMKYKSRILSKKHLWIDHAPEEYIVHCVKRCLMEKNEQGVTLDFMGSCIEKDSEESMIARRNGFIRFVVFFCLRNPWLAIYNMSASIFRKGTQYFYPCVPVIELTGPLDIDHIQNVLSRNLVGVFARIIVCSHNIGFFRQRKMQAMQQLLVYYREIPTAEFHLKSSDLPNVDLRFFDRDIIPYEIMNMMAQYNERFNKPKKGFVVALLGPDGSGKSTVLGELVSRTATLGSQTRQFHLWPRHDRQAAKGGTVTDPHALAPRSLAASILKLLLMLWRYNIGWLTAVFKPYRRSGMIWFDRYYHDILADPKRYRMGVPTWLVRLFGRLIPQPDLFLILDVQPEVARARKTEVSEAESERQYHAYRALAKELPNAVLIDANGTPEEVVAACERAVVEVMARRLDRRMGWSRTARVTS